MRTRIVWMAAVLVLSAGAAHAQGEKGGWHPVENIPGCTVWNPDPQPGETATWSGSCVAGKVEGQGTLIWRFNKDGKAYEGRGVGTKSAGRWTGHYVYSDPNRLRFEGDENARGVIVWVNGDRYEGDFREGKRTGRGILTFGRGEWEGDRYEGDFQDGARTGRGIYTWANGDRYEGDFRDGEHHGRGTFTWATGDRYEGEFQNGDITGNGILTWRNGTRFAGTFRDSEPAGAGICTKDGRTGRCRIENDDVRWLD